MATLTTVTYDFDSRELVISATPADATIGLGADSANNHYDFIINGETLRIVENDLASSQVTDAEGSVTITLSESQNDVLVSHLDTGATPSNSASLFIPTHALYDQDDLSFFPDENTTINVTFSNVPDVEPPHFTVTAEGIPVPASVITITISAVETSTTYSLGIIDEFGISVTEELLLEVKPTTTDDLVATYTLKNSDVGKTLTAFVDAEDASSNFSHREDLIGLIRLVNSGGVTTAGSGRAPTTRHSLRIASSAMNAGQADTQLMPAKWNPLKEI